MNSDVVFLLALTILPVFFWVLGRVLYAHWLVERHNQTTTPLKEFSPHPSQQDYLLAKTHKLSIRFIKSLSATTIKVLSVAMMLSIKTTKKLITNGIYGFSSVQSLLKQRLRRKPLKN